MANIDEIFSSMPAPAAEVEYEYLTLDETTLQIVIPESEKIFGVENDSLTERKHFKFPRYVGNNVDLAACFLQAVFQNANGEKDRYIIQDAAVQGENITFSWEFTRKVTKYRGQTQFLICASFPGNNGVFPEWHTTVATGNVLQGLEHDAANAEAETADVISQLLALVDTQSTNVEAVGAAQVQAVQTEGSTQVQAVETAAATVEASALQEIEGKKTNVLAAIPDDYTTMGNAVDMLTRTTAGAIVCTAQGETIQVHDSSDHLLPGLRIFGKTVQQKTTGKNLLDVSEENALYLTGYKNYTVTDGTINGTGLSYFMFKMQVTHGTTYTVSVKKKATAGTCHFRIYEYAAEPTVIATDDANYINSAKNMPCAGDTSIMEQYTPSAATVKWVGIGFYTTEANVFRELMAEIGPIATAYEPYTGGMAAPSPAWPQELKSVEAPVVAVCGKNLLSNGAATLTHNGITYTVNADKSVTVEGTATDNAMLNMLTVYTLPEQFRAGAKYRATGGTDNVSLQVYTHNKTTGAWVHVGAGAAFDVTLPEDAAGMLVRFVVKPGVTVNKETVYPMICLPDTTPSTYETYKAVQTVTLKNDLPGIPVASGGNYTDATGQQWICDEVDMARGVYAQRVGKTEFAGVTWTVNSNGKYFTNTDRGKYSPAYPVLCTNIPGGKQSDGGKETVIFVNANQDIRLNITLDPATAENVAATMEDAVLYGVLSTPVETALTEAELAAFAAMHSNKPTTTLLNDAGAHMALDYVADTKTYIDNKFAELSAAITQGGTA